MSLELAASMFIRQEKTNFERTPDFPLKELCLPGRSLKAN